MKSLYSKPSIPHRDSLHYSVAELLKLGEQYFLPEAVELMKRVSGKQRLTDDEILLLVITAVQAIRAYYVEPENNAAKGVFDKLLQILDHEEVVRAEYNKLNTMFRDSPEDESEYAAKD
jgi:hypothetical protein